MAVGTSSILPSPAISSSTLPDSDDDCAPTTPSLHRSALRRGDTARCKEWRSEPPRFCHHRPSAHPPCQTLTTIVLRLRRRFIDRPFAEVTPLAAKNGGRNLLDFAITGHQLIHPARL